jgi:hypothetical protein
MHPAHAILNALPILNLKHLTNLFRRVKSKLEETKIWPKRKEKRKSAVAVADEILEIKNREIKNQESLPDFLSPGKVL